MTRLRTAPPIALSLALAVGCGQPDRPQEGAAPAVAADPAVEEDLRVGLDRAINDASIRYNPVQYNYDEELLDQFDKAEARLAGTGADGAPARLLPKMEEQEELDHFRETIRRWEARSGKKLRPQIDALKAEVAARKPGGPAFHPEFHKRFAVVFDDLIKLEVNEMLERRNRAIHEQAAPLLAKYRERAPDLVSQYESTLNAPPYALAAPKADADSAADADRPRS